jgi:hypothetical protein
MKDTAYKIVAVAAKTIKTRLKAIGAIVLIVVVFVPLMFLSLFLILNYSAYVMIATLSIFLGLTILMIKYAQEMLRYGNFEFRTSGNDKLDSIIFYGLIILLIAGLIIGNSLSKTS